MKTSTKKKSEKRWREREKRLGVGWVGHLHEFEGRLIHQHTCRIRAASQRNTPKQSKRKKDQQHDVSVGDTVGGSGG